MSWPQITWVCTSAFSYGVHIAVLNGLQSYIVCDGGSIQTNSVLPSCIPMTRVAFGYLTSVYTIGGLVGSLLAGSIVNTRGKKGTLIVSSQSIVCGAFIMAAAPNLVMMILGRCAIGFGCGIATVVCPIYLAEISAQSPHKSMLGILTQLSICTGIVFSISLAIPFGGPSIWRCVPLISGVLSGLQILASGIMHESDFSEAPLQADALGLLEESGEALRSPTSTVAPLGHLSVKEVLATSESNIRRGLAIVMATQFAAQISGINAVMYYSTSILSDVVATRPVYISLLVAIANALTTFAPFFLVERYGRRHLLLLSGYLCAACTFMLGFSINQNFATLASLSIISFVSAFSIGLGAIPFILIPEVMPAHAAPAGGSIGLATNWIVNLLVGSTFLQATDYLSSFAGAGSIFYIFSAASATMAFSIGRLYNP